MTAEQYIIQQINAFEEKFPQVRVRYQHDAAAEAHVIEVLPNSTYYHDEKYVEWEEDLFEKFIKLYPENICFITDDDLVGIDKVNYEKQGREYMEYSVRKHTYTTFETANIHQLNGRFINFAINYTEEQSFGTMQEEATSINTVKAA